MLSLGWRRRVTVYPSVPPRCVARGLFRSRAFDSRANHPPFPLWDPPRREPRPHQGKAAHSLSAAEATSSRVYARGRARRSEFAMATLRSSSSGKIYYATLDAIATVRSMFDKALQLHLHLGLRPARLSDPAWAHRRLLGPSRWTVWCCAVCHIPACRK